MKLTSVDERRQKGLVIEFWYFCSGWSSLVFVFIHFPSTFCYSAAYAYPSNCNTGQKGYNFPFIKNEVDLKREHNHHKLNKHCTLTQVFLSHLGRWDLCSDGRRMCEGYDVNLVNALMRTKKYKLWQLGCQSIAVCARLKKIHTHMWADFDYIKVLKLVCVVFNH